MRHHRRQAAWLLMPRPRSGAQPQHRKSLDKAIRVLEAFTESAPERAEVDLARELDLPRRPSTGSSVAWRLTGSSFRSPVRQLSPWARGDPAGQPAAASFDAALVLRPALERVAGGDAGARPARGAGSRRTACPLRGGDRFAPATACRRPRSDGRSAHGRRDRQGAPRVPARRRRRGGAGRAARVRLAVGTMLDPAEISRDLG